MSLNVRGKELACQFGVYPPKLKRQVKRKIGKRIQTMFVLVAGNLKATFWLSYNVI